jgi:polysaccharide pyruvyl transferase WcaK-like protein
MTRSETIHPRPRIALLSPYTGGNLGDGAIHVALMAGIRERCPAVEFVGINSHPDRTSALHGMECHSLSAIGLVKPVKRASARPEAQDRGVDPSSSGTARSWPSRLVATSALRPLRDAARACRQVPAMVRAVYAELAALRPHYRLLSGVDLLVMAGGGQIDEEWGGPWGHPFSLFRWCTLSRLAGTPVHFLSVGASELRSPLSRAFVRLALSCATYRSYRDEDSKRRVGRWRFTQADACVPDLAFSLPDMAADGVASRQRDLVAVSPIIYGHPDHWPTERRLVYERYIEELARFVAGLVSSERDVLVLTSSRSDQAAVRTLVGRLATMLPPAALERHVEAIDPADVNALMRGLSRATHVVASRLHSVILAHVLHKPVLAISFAPKVEAHMRDMGQAPYLVGIQEVSAAGLAELFATLDAHRAEVHAELRARSDAFKPALSRQYDELVASLYRDSPQLRAQAAARPEGHARREEVTP